jgi:hypothetical protein
LRTAIDRLRRLAPLLDVVERSRPSLTPEPSMTPQLKGFAFAHCLGRGAFGEVWLAHDLILQAARAVKLLPRQRLTDAAQAQLVEEGRRMAALPKHRHRVQVHAFYPGVDNCFLVMEYVDGGSLLTQTSPEHPLPWERAGRYMAEVGDALADLHAAGLLHCDLKPSNILWDQRRDEVLLADYGISMYIGQAGLSGTAGYLAPELDGGLASPRSDVFALAATFFCLVTGRPPFPTDVLDNLTTARMGLARPVRALEHLPQAVQELILAGLDPKPEQRPELAVFVARLRHLHLQALADRLRTLAQPVAGSVHLHVNLAASRADGLAFQPLALLSVDTGPDKENSGPEPLVLQTGDLVRIEAAADADGYLTVLSFGSSGQLQIVFPNPLAPDNRTPAGQTRRLTLKVKPPSGTDQVALLWTRHPSSTAADAWRRRLEAGHGPALAAAAVRDVDFVLQETAPVPRDSWTAVVVTLVHHDGKEGAGL